MRRTSDGYAVLAQLVERIHGKDEVTGSNPVDGSRGAELPLTARRKSGGCCTGKCQIEERVVWVGSVGLWFGKILG